MTCQKIRKIFPRHRKEDGRSPHASIHKNHVKMQGERKKILKEREREKERSRME